MKRIISILLFFVVVLSSIVFLTKTANAYEDAGKRIRIIKQAQDKYKKLLLPGHTSNLKDAGCGLFSIAHAMQWLSEKKLTEDEELQLMKKLVDWKFDTAPNDYSKNKGNYRGMANCLSALTKKDTTLVYHKGALNKKNLTESKVKEIFDQGGVIITLQTHHWVCAVGYRYDDKGKLYIQIVDSSAVSTIEPRSGWNLHKGYKYDSLNEIKKSDDNSGGKQYWIPFNCYCGKCNHQRGFIDWYWLSGYSSTLGGPKCKDVSLYALSLKEINVYQLNDTSSSLVKKIPAFQTIHITGTYPRESNDPTWYRIDNGQYIEANKSSIIGPVVDKGFGKQRTEYSVTVLPIRDNTGLYFQPYSDSVCVYKVNKNTELTVQAVVLNESNRYWLEVKYDGRTFYLCANNVALKNYLNNSGIQMITFLPKPVYKFNEPSNYKGPTNGQNYSLDTKSITLAGKITGPTTIKRYVAGWYYNDSEKKPAVTESKGEVNATAIDISDKINKELKATELMKLGKQNYIYRISLFYYYYQNVTSDQENPLKEVSKPWIYEVPFTVGGGKETKPKDVLVSGISLDNSNVSLKKGEIKSIKATVSPSDATTKTVVWSSSNSNVAKVEGGKITAIGKGTAIITALAQDGSGKKATCTVTVTQPVTEVIVSPSTSIIYIGDASLQLSVTVNPSDANDKSVTWSSSRSDVAIVDSNGKVTAQAVGKTNIVAKANDGSGKQGTCAIEVRSYVNNISISGNNSVNVGSTIDLKAVVNPDNAYDKTIEWTSSDNSKAFVDSNGRVTGKGPGDVTITAKAKDRGIKTATKTVTVRQLVTGISITGATHEINAGETLQLTERVLPDNATNKTVEWKSNDENVATVSQTGLVTAISGGKAEITARAKDGSGIVSVAYTINVAGYVERIVINGNSSVRINGNTILEAIAYPENAANKNISWSSSDETIATVDENGKVTGLRKGSVEITAVATDRSLIYATRYVSVYQAATKFKWEIPDIVLAGSIIDISPTIEPSDAYFHGFWSISSKYDRMAAALMRPGSDHLYTIEPIYNSRNALFKALRTGICEVVFGYELSPSSTTGRTQTKIIRIVQPVTSIVIDNINPIGINGTGQINCTVEPSNAYNKKLLWTSSNTDVATVDNQGIVTGHNPGTAVITASSTDGSEVVSNEITVEVIRKISVAINGDNKMFIGTPQQLTATVYSDIVLNDYGVNWTSSNEAIATVDENGTVTGISNGTVIITATSKEDTTSTSFISIEVQTRMAILQITGEAVIDEGFSAELISLILPEETSEKTLHWQSSDNAIATVNAEGIITAVAPGEVIITASSMDGSNLTATKTITVYPTIEEIKLSGANMLHPEDTVQWCAEIIPVEVRNKNVIWSTSNEEVAVVDQNGNVTAVANGTAEIIVTSDFNNEIVLSKTVTVTTLISGITITGENALDKSQLIQLSASVEPVTASDKTLIWTSDNTAVATVNTDGLVEALSEGTAVITASAADGSQVEGSFQITVYPLPASVLITGSNALLSGETTQLTATVLPEEARNRSVIWTSSDLSIATVDSEGVVTAVGNGTVIITGIAQGNNQINETHEITVTTLISSIEISAPEKINVGETDAVEVTILPSTASNKKLKWSSNDEEIAVVDDSGNITGVTPGFVIITAEATDESGILAEIAIEIFQPILSISVDVEPAGFVGQSIVPQVIIYPDNASAPVVEFEINDEELAEIRTEGETNEPCSVIDFKKAGVVKLTANATDGSGVFGSAYILVLAYTELESNLKEYTLYSGGNMDGKIGLVALSEDCISRATEDKCGAIWNIEHISGDCATIIGINENIINYNGFPLANSVDLKLLQTEQIGTDVYRVSCTVSSQTDSCDVTIHVVEPEVPLPESVRLSTETYCAQVGETININTIPVLTPSGSALPEETSSFLYGQGTFNRYAQVSMENEVFTVQFNKAGTYSGYVRYSGTNYQYDAQVEFVITSDEGTLPPEIEEININNPLVYMLPGETARFDVDIRPSSADGAELLWSSSEPEVVTVDDNGNLVALKPGTSIISVSSDNGVSATGCVVVTETLLSIDWNEEDEIEVYISGNTRTLIQRIYLTARASAQLSEAPVWSLKRIDGNNLTLMCEPITGKDASGQDLYGCAVILKSVSATGVTEYELSCTDGEYTASTVIKVNANEIESQLPSMVSWNNDTFTGSVNELLSIRPLIQCWPDETILPDSVLVSVDGDSYWNAALNKTDYSVSRNAMTFSFKEPGVYTANCIYSCSNMRYLVPITVQIADENGIVPIRLTDLTLNENEISIKAGDTAQLKAIIAPTDATNKAIVWSSENPAVAAVSETGLVSGVANGRTNIWCVPDDPNCAAVKCVVVVEDEFTVIQTDEMDTQYLQGDTGYAAASFRLSAGTARRLEAAGLTPEWSCRKISGTAAEAELTERDGIRYLTVKNLLASGTDKYMVTCSAGDYTWNGQVTLTVSDSGTVPNSVAVSQNDYTAEIGEEIELDFTPTCEPGGTSIPFGMRVNYIGIGQFYNGLKDSYRSQVLTSKKDKIKVAFKKKGTYLLSRYYRDCNLTYITECTITVGDEAMNLLKCRDQEATVYVGGKPCIASTCVISDTSIEELYGDEIVWNAERLKGDCLQVALRADQSSASLYVVNALEEGEETWRVSCTFRGITDYVDITIQAVEPEIELPENVALRQTEFSGMIGNRITVPLAVQCEPEGTALPSIEDEAWRFVTDGNTAYNAVWTIAENRMNISFRESGYYGGRLIYQSGNVSYSFPISFAITDEESVLPSPEQMDVSISDEIMTVYPEGVTGVPVVKAVLSDSMDAYSMDSIAAYAQSKNAVWSLEIVSGNACDLSVRNVSASAVEIVLGEMTGIGDVHYRVSCAVEGNQYSAEGTIHVAAETETRPQPELKETYFLSTVGTMITIDASFYEKTSNAKLCTGKDSEWENSEALAAMGYDYKTSDDLLMPVFYQDGVYTTTITNRISNLICSQEIRIVIHTSRPVPENPSKLMLPGELLVIDEEAFEGINVNVIDLRGTKVQEIHSRAFADNTGLLRIYIPDTVISISPDAFDGCPDVEICCSKGSNADIWAKQVGYPVNYGMD